MSNFKGKFAVITGAANGIGKALSTKCAMLGINLVLIDIDYESLSRIKSDFDIKYPSVTVLPYKCDISNEQTVKDMVNKFKSDYYLIPGITKSQPIIIHFLFNNAGISSFTNVLTGDLNRMHKTMNVNLWGIIYVTQSFLPFMRNIGDVTKDGYDDDRFIINTSSIAGIATADSFYAVTKHGVTALSEVFQAELRGYNKKCKKEQNGRGIINVSCLVPSYVKSQFLESTAKVHDIKNVYDKLRREKTYNSGRPHPEMFEASGIDPSMVADIVFNDGIKNKLFWINTHEDWTKCTAIDRFYSIYTQKFNRYEATKKVFNRYQQNLKRVIDNKSKSKL